MSAPWTVEWIMKKDERKSNEKNIDREFYNALQIHMKLSILWDDGILLRNESFDIILELKQKCSNAKVFIRFPNLKIN